MEPIKTNQQTALTTETPLESLSAIEKLVSDNQDLLNDWVNSAGNSTIDFTIAKSGDHTLKVSIPGGELTVSKEELFNRSIVWTLNEFNRAAELDRFSSSGTIAVKLGDLKDLVQREALLDKFADNLLELKKHKVFKNAVALCPDMAHQSFEIYGIKIDGSGKVYRNELFPQNREIEITDKKDLKSELRATVYADQLLQRRILRLEAKTIGEADGVEKQFNEREIYTTQEELNNYRKIKVTVGGAVKLEPNWEGVKDKNPQKALENMIQTLRNAFESWVEIVEGDLLARVNARNEYIELYGLKEKCGIPTGHSFITDKNLPQIVFNGKDFVPSLENQLFPGTPVEPLTSQQIEERLRIAIQAGAYKS